MKTKAPKLKALIMMAANPMSKPMMDTKTEMMKDKKMGIKQNPIESKEVVTKKKKKKKPTQSMKSTGSIMANINKKGK